jgi:hypothetical protein
MKPWSKRVLIAAATVAAAGIFCPAAAQAPKDSGIPSETQERLRMGQTQDWDWGWLGLLGVFGLAGLRHDPDYHHAI